MRKELPVWAVILMMLLLAYVLARVLPDVFFD